MYGRHSYFKTKYSCTYIILIKTNREYHSHMCWKPTHAHTHYQLHICNYLPTHIQDACLAHGHKIRFWRSPILPTTFSTWILNSMLYSAFLFCNTIPVLYFNGKFNITELKKMNKYRNNLFALEKCFAGATWLLWETRPEPSTSSFHCGESLEILAHLANTCS